jgi:threonine synthase
VSFRTVCTACEAPQPRTFAVACPECGGLTDVEYELDEARLSDTENPYRRFADLLPVHDPSLLPDDAAATPAIHAAELGKAVGIRGLYLKDETKLPTGTTKDRMANVALAYMAEHGVRSFAVSSTGNSSTAFAHAIGRFPELVMHLFTAAEFADRVVVPDARQVHHHVLRDATFVEAVEAARGFAAGEGITFEGGFFNPGRREGLKLAWLEATDQVRRPIDWYVQAVSSAMGVYGVFNGARQLSALGRIERLPRLLCVQQETCAPMVSAWRDGSDRIRPGDVVERPTGIATAILRGDPSGAYPHVRRTVAASRGTFVAVSEQEIVEAQRAVYELAGIDVCFAAAAAVAGVAKSRRLGDVGSDETVLVNLTGRDRLSARSSGAREPLAAAPPAG